MSIWVLISFHAINVSNVFILKHEMMHLFLDNRKVNVENTKITTENISISVSQLQIKQRN